MKLLRNMFGKSKEPMSELDSEYWSWTIPESLIHTSENGPDGFSCTSKDEARRLFVRISERSKAETAEEVLARFSSVIDRAMEKALGAGTPMFVHHRFEHTDMTAIDIGGYSAKVKFGIFTRVWVSDDFSYYVSIHDYWTPDLDTFKTFSGTLIGSFRPKK